ncbi:MAG TPA: MFS transporter [Jatrophihabitans sp.]|nr:MFS transporter [Jatrophihabitans sp.]
MKKGWHGVAAGMFAVGWGANQFSSMLIAYRDQRGLSTATDDGLFGIYAIALIMALLLGGPAADRWGRRYVVRPAVVASIVASALLVAGDHSVGLLYAGRFVAGLASGAIFAAGSAWVKELSRESEDAGARRAALALSFGFGLGPLAAGLVAQWAPYPLVTAYVPHLVIATGALAVLWTAPETVRGPAGPSYLARLRIRGVGQPRFRRVVLPAAVWVFAGPSIAMVVLPELVSAHLHGYPLVFSGVAAVLTLGTGVAVQRIARRLDRPGQVTGLLVGLGATTAGVLLGALTALTANPALALLAAVPLGAGYGLLIVSGLLETQRLAAPEELAGLTAVYYALTYVGFGLPLLLAWLHSYAGYPAMLCVVAGVAVLCALTVAVHGRAGQPGRLRSESAAEVR